MHYFPRDHAARAAAVILLLAGAGMAPAAAQEVLFQDDFKDAEVGQRPQHGYRFIGFPEAEGSAADGVVAEEGDRMYLQFSRPEELDAYPMPAVIREFARQPLGEGRSFEIRFALRPDAATGAAVQFAVKNAQSGPEGMGQAIYFKPSEGVWILDAQGMKHYAYQGVLEPGRWVEVSLRVSLPERSAILAVTDPQSDEVIGETPRFDLQGKTTGYVDQLVIARAEAPAIYRYGFTGLSLTYP